VGQKEEKRVGGEAVVQNSRRMLGIQVPYWCGNSGSGAPAATAPPSSSRASHILFCRGQPPSVAFRPTHHPARFQLANLADLRTQVLGEVGVGHRQYLRSWQWSGGRQENKLLGVTHPQPNPRGEERAVAKGLARGGWEKVLHTNSQHYLPGLQISGRRLTSVAARHCSATYHIN